MKPWQLSVGFAVLAIATGQLDAAYFATVDPFPPVPAEIDRVVGTATGRFDGPERHEPSNGQSKVRLKLIDEWIRDSQSVRTCFFEVSQTLGYLPDAEVRINLTQSGSTNDVLVMEPGLLQYTDLEVCLLRAFRDLWLPTYEGATPLSARYRFKF
jgi:hypothetical protein